MTQRGQIKSLSGRQDVFIHFQDIKDAAIKEIKFQGSEDKIMKDHTKLFLNNLQLPGERPFFDSQDGPTRIMVLSSQMGVGKSTITFFLASAMSHAKFRVLLVNLDRQNPSLTKIIETVQDYQFQPPDQLCSNDEAEIIYSLSQNLDFVNYRESRRYLADERATELDYYNAYFKSIISSYDCVLYDTHTGLNELNLSILQESNVAILVSTSDASSISDTYALIKASSPYIIDVDLGLVINQVLDKKSSLEVYKDLHLALRNFMERDIKLLGLIQTDEMLKNFPKKYEFRQGDNGNISALKQIEEMAPKLFVKKTQNIVKWS
jgi:flagellar biosynthesis protein FlhG